MEVKVLYGAGKLAQMIVPFLAQKYEIDAVIDANPNLTGHRLFDIPIITIDEYISKYNRHDIIIVLNKDNTASAIKILEESKVTNYVYYTEYLKEITDNRESIVSYSQQFEDLILYNSLQDAENIYYIDVGCNDPVIDSVTKLFYDNKNAHGINIDPLDNIINFTSKLRKRDVNLCVAVGDKEGSADIYMQGIQGGLSTLLKENISETFFEGKKTVKVTTLKKICDDNLHIGQEISFLKIDVEGLEKQVLLGADFDKYRPLIIVMESTLPNTYNPCYEEWEYILHDNKYHFVYSYGVNRYYVANEHTELDDKFEPIQKLLGKYRVSVLTAPNVIL